MSQNRTALPSRAAVTPALFATRAQIVWLLLGILVTAAFIGMEVTHYAVATDLGALDSSTVGVSLQSHPQCRDLENSFNISCPFPVYNSVQLACGEFACSMRNPNLPPYDEQFDKALIARRRSDSIASLEFEAPYSRNDSDWQMHARQLRSNQIFVKRQIASNRPPQVPEDALLVQQAREFDAFHQFAQAWMRQHAK